MKDVKLLVKEWICQNEILFILNQRQCWYRCVLQNSTSVKNVCVCMQNHQMELQIMFWQMILQVIVFQYILFCIYLEFLKEKSGARILCYKDTCLSVCMCFSLSPEGFFYCSFIFKACSFFFFLSAPLRVIPLNMWVVGVSIFL